MAEVALTILGLAKDDKRVDIEAGEKVPAWVPKDELEHLRKIGAVGEVAPTVEEVNDKDAEIEALKAKIAELTKPAEPPVDNKSTGAGTK